MVTVTATEYQKDFKAFINKYIEKYDVSIHTSPIKDNTYRKIYTFDNGSEFYEITYLKWTERVKVEVHGIITTADVELIKHEYWSTDDSESKCWYEGAYFF